MAVFGKFVGGIVESTSTRFSGLSEQRIGLPAKENFQRFGLVDEKVAPPRESRRATF
jgi:hypothetical protein